MATARRRALDCHARLVCALVSITCCQARCCPCGVVWSRCWPPCPVATCPRCRSSVSALMMGKGLWVSGVGMTWGFERSDWYEEGVYKLAWKVSHCKNDYVAGHFLLQIFFELCTVRPVWMTLTYFQGYRKRIDREKVHVKFCMRGVFIELDPFVSLLMTLPQGLSSIEQLNLKIAFLSGWRMKGCIKDENLHGLNWSELSTWLDLT